MLTQSDDALSAWRARLLSAVDGSGQLVIDVVPEVEHIIGPQPAMPALSAAEARNRFRLVFGNLIGAALCDAQRPAT